MKAEISIRNLEIQRTSLSRLLHVILQRRNLGTCLSKPLQLQGMNIADHVQKPHTNGHTGDERSSKRRKVNDQKRIILNAFVMNTPGHLAPGLWRHPRNKTDQYKKLSFWTDLAKLLDKANFHAMFIVDTLGPNDVYKGPANAVPALAAGAQFPVNDPLYLVPAMAAATRNLIFGVTASLTYEKPYSLARRLSTVDHLSEGRLAWNKVTSYLDSAARNHGLKEQIPHDERYAIAHEYMEVLYKLREGSFRDDAVIADRETGVYIAPDAVRQIHHKGKYFEVPGPAFTEPSPQRTPLLFQGCLPSREWFWKQACGVDIRWRPGTRRCTLECRQHSQSLSRRRPRSKPYQGSRRNQRYRGRNGRGSERET